MLSHFFPQGTRIRTVVLIPLHLAQRCAKCQRTAIFHVTTQIGDMYQRYTMCDTCLPYRTSFN